MLITCVARRAQSQRDVEETRSQVHFPSSRSPTLMLFSRLFCCSAAPYENLKPSVISPQRCGATFPTISLLLKTMSESPKWKCICYFYFFYFCLSPPTVIGSSLNAAHRRLHPKHHFQLCQNMFLFVELTFV